MCNARLTVYQYTLEYRKRGANRNVDLLSRLLFPATVHYRTGPMRLTTLVLTSRAPADYRRTLHRPRVAVWVS